MRANVDSLSLRSARLWLGVVVGVVLGAAIAVFMPPALLIVLIGLSLWLLVRRRGGHPMPPLVLGILLGLTLITCAYLIAALIQSGTPTTGHGTGRG